jgi:threonine/homoserine/homoserine lactone efflux protein
VWTFAAAFGVASVVRASAVAVTLLKLIGAVCGSARAQTLRAAGGANGDDQASLAAGSGFGARGGLRQGFLSDLANPKIAIFFTSLLRHFADPRRPILLLFLPLGAVFVPMTVLRRCTYSLIAARADTLREPRVEAALDRFTGVALIAVGTGRRRSTVRCCRHPHVGHCCGA